MNSNNITCRDIKYNTVLTNMFVIHSDTNELVICLKYSAEQVDQ